MEGRGFSWQTGVGAIFAFLALGASLTACSEGRRLTAAESRGLPRLGFELQYLCPEASDIHGAKAARIRAEERAKLVALARAYRRYGPDAQVRVRYLKENDPEPQWEETTLEQVVKENLDILRETDCSRAAQRQLEKLLD